MSTITEDYVSFETAKLLKEKSFNEICYLGYNKNGEYVPTSNRTNSQIIQPDFCFICCPTLQMAMKWLRETKDWHIVLTPMFADDIKGKMVLYGYDWEISSPSREQTEHSKDFLPNYEQAAEEAIKYCLENLI